MFDSKTQKTQLLKKKENFETLFKNCSRKQLIRHQIDPYYLKNLK